MFQKKTLNFMKFFFICCIVPSGILAIRTYIKPADAREVAENSHTYPLCTHVESDVLVLGLAKRILIIGINFSFLKMIISIFKCFKKAFHKTFWVYRNYSTVKVTLSKQWLAVKRVTMELSTFEDPKWKFCQLTIF